MMALSAGMANMPSVNVPHMMALYAGTAAVDSPHTISVAADTPTVNVPHTMALSAGTAAVGAPHTIGVAALRQHGWGIFRESYEYLCFVDKLVCVLLMRKVKI